MAGEMTDAQKERLKPWAEQIANVYDRIWEWVNDSDDEQVIALLDAAESASPTNCWWATYEVAQEVKKAARARISRAAAPAQEGD